MSDFTYTRKMMFHFFSISVISRCSLGLLYMQPFIKQSFISLYPSIAVIYLSVLSSFLSSLFVCTVSFGPVCALSCWSLSVSRRDVSVLPESRSHIPPPLPPPPPDFSSHPRSSLSSLPLQCVSPRLL